MCVPTSSWVIALGSFGVATTAGASAYTSGLDRYQQGDFAGAEKILRGALGTRMAPRELASTYKLLGICQFMQNNRAGATQSFKMALATDPATLISANEVLDDGVIGFFNKIRASSPKPAATAAKKAPASPGAMKMAARRATDSKGNLLKQTFLIINSTNKGANVFIDGIIAGQVNNRINTSPGKVLVEVAQPGFKPKKVRINITKDADNAVNINLDKIQPKAPPRPKAPPTPTEDDLGIAVAAGARGAKSKNGGRRALAGKSRAAAPKDDLFGESPVTQAPPPVQSGPRIAQAPSTPPQMAQQPHPQAMMPQGYPPQMGYPMQGYGQMGYPQQAAPYPPPGYYPPPSYYPQAPQVIIQQAPPSYYGSPDMSPAPMPANEPLPPPPSIDSDPGGSPSAFDGGGGPPPEPSMSPESLGDPGFGAPASSGSRGGRSGSGGGSGSGSKGNANVAMYLLPLGVGQFVNGRPLLGIAFLGAQVGSAAYGFLNYQTAEKRTKEINDFQTNNCTDATDEDFDACEEYVQAGRANVLTINQYKLYGFIGAGAAYGLSVIQAFLDTPTKTAKKKKRRGFSLNESPAIETAAENTYDDEIATDSGFKWRFDVAPHYNGLQSVVEPALTVNLDWRF